MIELLVCLGLMAIPWIINKIFSKEGLMLIALTLLCIGVYRGIEFAPIFASEFGLPLLTVLFILILSGACYKFAFWITHQRPLNEDEIKELSSSRRIKYINERFQFTHGVVGVNPSYRASLNADGRWDRIDIPIKELPSLVSQLLRYKRHEWSLWCLCDDLHCKLLWANKGYDNQSCYFKGSMEQLAILAVQEGCSTLIHMHNHPHTQERYGNLLSPSTADLETLESMKEFCETVGLNFIDGICSQGEFKIFGCSFPDNYFPDDSSVDIIKNQNGISKKRNYQLHKELKKTRKIKLSNPK